MIKKQDKKHEEIVDITFELVKGDKGTYFDVKKEKQLEELNKETGITYRPDVHAYAKKRKGMIDVYEVWHSQSWAKAFLDIINSLLTPGIDWIHIIVVQRDKWSDSWEKNDIRKIKASLNQVLKCGERKKLLRLEVLGIKEEDLQDKEKLRKLIGKSFGLL